MATKLQSVILEGWYRGEPATVEFRRLPDGTQPGKWIVHLQAGRRTKSFVLEDRHAKPCWTVAVALMDVNLQEDKPRKTPAKRQTRGKRALRATRVARPKHAGEPVTIPFSKGASHGGN